MSQIRNFKDLETMDDKVKHRIWLYYLKKMKLIDMKNIIDDAILNFKENSL